MQDNQNYCAVTDVRASFVVRFLIQAHQKFKDQKVTKLDLRCLNVPTYGNEH